MGNQTFIDTIAAIARKNSSQILASLTIAQACLESNFGASDLATEGFNLFGIKGQGTDGSIQFPTQEWDGEQMQTVQADFRKYHSWEESIADHVTLLTGLDRYSNLIGETDFARVAYLIYKDGYATDPNYTDLLKGLYAQYNLAQYDAPEVDVSEWAKGSRDLLMAKGVTDGSRPKDAATREEVWAMLNNLWYAMDHQAASSKEE